MSQPLDASQVESLLRDAGAYVGPSDDLRPRVLEAVREARNDGRRRRRVVLAATAALLLVSVVSVETASLSGRLSSSTPSQRVSEIVSSGETTTKRAGVEAYCWALVDAFLRVRGEQADAINGDR